MLSALSSFTLAVIWLFLPYGRGQCYDNEVYHAAGDKWIRNGNFLVICDVNKIKVNVNVCSEHFADTNDDLYKDRFVICCISRRFKGCIDDNGDLLKDGFFTIGTALKYCNIRRGGMSGRIEPRGCFNGTRTDDPSDETLHVKKYTTWRQGDKELRCGDNGIHVLKCYLKDETSPVAEGTGWIDEKGIVHVCK
ncbi:hypothetical protein WR25_00013 [Diploscapter pachys]|uniref:Cyanovirin-N domain-containing protein n=1 Tax=Diploscapter pachys TaxID=2018661 RepID=A0A2A2KE93_9BILA|nr:hypothetical protein WR25_00013 [Diploscapter pachys]